MKVTTEIQFINENLGTDAEGWLPRAYLLESTASKKPPSKLKSRTSIN